MNSQIGFTDTAKADLRDIALYLAELSKDKGLAICFMKQLLIAANTKYPT